MSIQPDLREIEVACVENGGRIFFALHARGGREPRSAVVRLIQGVYREHPALARRILRGRILASTSPGEMERGMVKVAAKRLTVDPAAVLGALREGTDAVDLSAATEVPDSCFGLGAPAGFSGETDLMALARGLAGRVPREGPRYAAARPVACVLAAESGEVLAWAANAAGSDRTRHAEVCLVQGFHERTGRLLPRGAVLHTTLKPCRMCAGMIWDCAEDLRTLRVRFERDDPGPNGRQTVLTVGTPERARAASSAGDLGLRDLVIERQLDTC